MRCHPAKFGLRSLNGSVDLVHFSSCQRSLDSRDGPLRRLCHDFEADAGTTCLPDTNKAATGAASGSISGRVCLDENADTFFRECDCDSALRNIPGRFYHDHCGGLIIQTVKTDQAGYFHFTGLEPGVYCVIADAKMIREGYQATRSLTQKVHVVAGESVEAEWFGLDHFIDINERAPLPNRRPGHGGRQQAGPRWPHSFKKGRGSYTVDSNSLRKPWPAAMADLFEADKEDNKPVDRPLPDRLRPRTLEEIVGQDHLVGPAAPIRRMIESGRLASMILWGPPGCGKTTLARILSAHTELHFEQLSAIFSGVQDLRKVFEAARVRQRNGLGTLLFVDEIHRFNKSQQDAFLPVVEDGTVVLVGATTENPSFELNAALLSRAQVYVLRRLDDDALETLLQRAEQDAKCSLPLESEARAALKAMADGDGRYVLSMAEQVLAQGEVLDSAALLQLVQRRAPLYDKQDDAHFNLISALHKSVRGSDADAALYWFARMLAGGEHPEYVARRMVRMAVEDIGLADPQALPTCIAAWQAYERLGSPEGELALAQALIYLATAPKSNAAYTAYGAARQAARETGSLTPPRHILNAPTRLMKEQGYGSGYAYDHDSPEAFSGQDYFPEDMERRQFYDPPERGFEREIRKRLAYWSKLRQQRG